MKMDYASSSCEGRAHELLAPLTGACPDSVWESISSELEERRLKASNNWLNKLNNTRTPLIVAAAIIVVTIAAWSLFSFRSINKSEVANTSTPVKQVTTLPTKQTVSVVTPEAKQMVAAENSNAAANQNTPVQTQADNSTIVKNERHKKVADSIANQTVANNTESTKEDNSPLVIHTNTDGEEPLTSSNVAGGKSVEIKLDRPDESGPNAAISQPSAEITTVADSAQ